MPKLRNGYRAIGPNTADGSTSVWYFADRDSADAFAQQQARATGEEIHVCEYLGSWRVPVEWVPAGPAQPEEER